MPSTKRIAAVCAALVLAGAGCAGTGGISIGDGSELDFRLGSWQLTAVTDRELGSFKATLMIDEDRLSGVVCNSMSGPYTMNGNELTAGPLAATKKFCSGIAGDVESFFMRDLGAGILVDGGGDELVLRGDTGTVYTFMRAPAEVTQE
jgi:heat shock protein HslJ